MTQSRNYANKKAGYDTEGDPLWNMDDIKRLVEWFEKHNDWDGYLITLFELLLGRRIGDIVCLRWSDFYKKDGRKENELNHFVEQKTGKNNKMPISKMVFESIENYLEHTKIDPMQHYDEEIFKHSAKEKWNNIEHQYFANGKNTITNVDHTVENWINMFNRDWGDRRIKKIQEGFNEQLGKQSRKYGCYDDIFDYIHYVVELKDAIKWHTDSYRKRFNHAIRDMNLDYRVTTHGLRKSFAYWVYTMHQFDPNCVYSIQKMFGHVNVLQTYDYMGVTKMRNRKYIEDHGDFVRNVLAGKGDEIVKNMPVISLKSDDFGKIIRMLTDDVDKYQKAINMANEMRVV